MSDMKPSDKDCYGKWQQGLAALRMCGTCGESYTCAEVAMGEQDPNGINAHDPVAKLGELQTVERCFQVKAGDPGTELVQMAWAVFQEYENHSEMHPADIPAAIIWLAKRYGVNL